MTDDDPDDAPKIFDTFITSNFILEHPVKLLGTLGNDLFFAVARLKFGMRWLSDQTPDAYDAEELENMVASVKAQAGETRPR
jgi:hypothetical protein